MERKGSSFAAGLARHLAPYGSNVTAKIEPFLTILSVKCNFLSNLDIPIQFCQMPGWKEFNIKTVKETFL